MSSTHRSILYITTSDPSIDVGGSVYSRSNIKLLREIFEVKVIHNMSLRYFKNNWFNKLLSFVLYSINNVPPHINYHSHKLLFNHILLKSELEFNYDHIVLENLQLYHYLETIGKPVIFISQNIESNLIKMRYSKIPSIIRKKIENDTKRTEYHFSKLSKGIISISTEETIVYKKHNDNCITLPPTFTKVLYPQYRRNQILTLGFLASSHWLPNVIAFENLVYDVLPKINVRCNVLIIGKGWDLMYKKINTQKNQNLKIKFFDYVKDLSYFWSSIDVLLAPVSAGAGINIKVCESIANNIKVIGYSNAFRGLPKEVKNLNYIVDNIYGFTKTINEINLRKNHIYSDYFMFNKNLVLIKNWLKKIDEK